MVQMKVQHNTLCSVQALISYPMQVTSYEVWISMGNCRWVF